MLNGTSLIHSTSRTKRSYVYEVELAIPGRFRDALEAAMNATTSGPTQSICWRLMCDVQASTFDASTLTPAALIVAHKAAIVAQCGSGVCF